MIESKKQSGEAIILEFQVRNPRKEAYQEDTLQAALRQIEEKQYEAAVVKRFYVIVEKKCGSFLERKACPDLRKFFVDFL